MEDSMLDADDELYAHERYKFGSKEQELAEFRDHVRRVSEAQKALAAEHSPGNPQRVFHAKAHACLAGTLSVLEDRPETTRHGIFGPNGKSVYNVLARFSSGVGFDQHDLKPDVRGLALKVFGVSDDSAGETRAPRTVDFLMTNSTNPFGRDQEGFVQFMEASVNPGVLERHLLGFLIAHPEVARHLMKATLRVVPSLATEQYWSGHPYFLGTHQAMKFNVRPVEVGQTETDSELQREMSSNQANNDTGLEHRIRQWFEMRTAAGSKLNPNYLSAELRGRLERGPLKFVFSVQLERDPQATPIEDALIEWKESDTPSIPVAELALDREIEAELCQNLRFTPGHFIPEHRPLGNLGRGRIFTYEASQIGRNAAAAEPEERRFFGA
jgi:catalase